MALEGGQGGDTRDSRSQDAEGLSGRDGFAGDKAPETPPTLDAAARRESSGTAPSPLPSEPAGFAQKKGSRSRSFAYQNDGSEGEYLTYAILTQPSQGWVTNNGDGTFSFDPGLDFQDLKPGETRRISFSYQVSDGWSGTETVSASLTVTGTPDGALAIEMAPGSPAKRIEPEQSSASREATSPERPMAEPGPLSSPLEAQTEAYTWAGQAEPPTVEAEGHAVPYEAPPEADAPAGQAEPPEVEPEGSASPLAASPEPGPHPDPTEQEVEPTPSDQDVADQAGATSPENPEATATDVGAIVGHGAEGPATTAEFANPSDHHGPASDGQVNSLPDDQTADGGVPGPAGEDLAVEPPRGEQPGAMASDPAGAPREMADQSPSDSGPAQGPPAEDANPFAAAYLDSNAWAAPDRDGEDERAPSAWAMEPAAPVDSRAASDDSRLAERSEQEPRAPDSGAPESGPSEDDQRYTILAQPPEGQVSATENGEFQFVPGPNFPKLEVGELHQISFTCEAVNGDGATNIVIASLTITGTSEDPEICDVSFRRAHDSGLDRSAESIAGEALSTADSPVTEDETGAATDSAADSWPADDHHGIVGTEVEAKPEPDGGEVLTAGPSDDEPNAETGIREPAAELPAEFPAPPATAPMTGAATADTPADPVAEAYGSAAAGEHDVASSDSIGGQQVDGAGWDAPTVSEPVSQSTPWPSADGDALSTWDAKTPAGPETAADEVLVPDADERLAEVAPADDSSETPVDQDNAAHQFQEFDPIEPAPEDPALDLDLGSGSTTSRNQAADPATASGFGSDPEPSTQPFAGHAPQSPEGSASTGVQDGRLPEPPDAAEDQDWPVTEATPLREGAHAAQEEQSNLARNMAAWPGPEPAGMPEQPAAGTEPEAPETSFEEVGGVDQAGEAPAETVVEAGDSHADRYGSALDDHAVPAQPAPEEQPALQTDAAVDDVAAAPPTDSAPSQPSGAADEDMEAPSAAAGGPAEEPGLSLVATDEEEDEPAELSDFTLSQHTVVEKCEAGTVVGQVLVAGAEEGSRFIFDLQNDAGGRFDINPRTGKITVADGALLDHAAADSHDILVQVIAHSGISCRKTLTIEVLAAEPGQEPRPAPEPPPAPVEAAEVPMPEIQGHGLESRPALPSGSSRPAYSIDDGEIGRREELTAEGSTVDTLHLDGVTGGPGAGGWRIELTEGEIIETNDDNLKLSENAAGSVMLDGCPAKVAFQGVERIEW